MVEFGDPLCDRYSPCRIPPDPSRIREIIPSLMQSASDLYDTCTSLSVTDDNSRIASESDVDFFSCLADLFRCLRWLSAAAPTDDLKEKDAWARTTLYRLKKAVSIAEVVVPASKAADAHPEIREAARNALSCGVQVLANCTRNCHPIQDLVWPEFCEVISSLIVLDDDKLLNYVCATIMNCINSARIDDMVDRGYAPRIFERISVVGPREDSMVTFEAVFDVAIALLHCPMVAQQDYDLLTLGAKSATLNILKTCFALTDSDVENPPLPPFWVPKIVEEFKKGALLLFGLKDASQNGDEECSIVLSCLNMLGALSACYRYRFFFFQDEMLFDVVVDTFLRIDDLSLQENNQFAAVLKLNSLRPQELITPARGLKTSLVRLTGNLAYENMLFQQHVKARFPTLVERLKQNTRIDYRNPYIQQWAVLALRNLHLSAALDELRRQHEDDTVNDYVPGVAHSVDGDHVSYSVSQMGRKHSENGSPLRRFGVPQSETVEALDLHVRHFSGPYEPQRRYYNRPRDVASRPAAAPVTGVPLPDAAEVLVTRETQTESRRVALAPGMRRNSLENVTEGEEEGHSGQDSRPRFQSR